MSKTTVTNVKTGEKFPKKTLKKQKVRKFFGFRKGDRGGNPNAKKGEDFINYGYPMEIRHTSEIKQHIQDEMTKKEIMDSSNFIEEIHKKANKRFAQLNDLEMAFNGEYFIGTKDYNKDFNVHQTEVSCDLDEEWDIKIKELTEELNRRKSS